MKQIKGGVTAAKGYEAASTAAGIKYQGRTDMALIYSQVPCVSAGTFTTNVVKAAPVKWDRQIVDSGAGVQAVIVNSGIANACTGEEGMGYCKETERHTAHRRLPDCREAGSGGQGGKGNLAIKRITEKIIEFPNSNSYTKTRHWGCLVFYCV